MQPFLVFTAIVLLFDLLTFKGIRAICQTTSLKTRILIYVIFWAVNFFVLFLSLSIYLRNQVGPPHYFNIFYYMVGLLVLIYVPKFIFLLFYFLDNLLLFSRFVIKRFCKAKYLQTTGNRWYIAKTGLVIAVIPFFVVLYGFFYGRFDFRIVNQVIEFQKLPDGFDGFKIVHISDLHLGGFYGHEKHVEKAVQLINTADADLVVITGDLINNFAGELYGWDKIFIQIQAHHGKFAVLGNHDYGDYSRWDTPEQKQENFEQIKEFFNKIGFSLLNDQNVKLNYGGDSIAIIGIENWGKPPFAYYGDLDIAMVGTSGIPFKILLSHDPSRWETEVVGITDISLTLAGHTHGMQIGIEKGSVSWSPAKFIFPQWGGLFQVNGQKIYVNRGLGFVGFPARIGMDPEITIITLKQAV